MHQLVVIRHRCLVTDLLLRQIAVQEITSALYSGNFGL